MPGCGCSSITHQMGYGAGPQPLNLLSTPICNVKQEGLHTHVQSHPLSEVHLHTSPLVRGKDILLSRLEGRLQTLHIR